MPDETCRWRRAARLSSERGSGRSAREVDTDGAGGHGLRLAAVRSVGTRSAEVVVRNSMESNGGGGRSSVERAGRVNVKRATVIER
jgi:hypothetical protein